jgi:uncharacterized repeat protein (TIGR01451 family)
MYCGAGDKTTLLYRINNGDGRNSSANLKQVYYNEGRGISEAGIKSAVDGEVHKDGTVWVGGKKVASGVFSSGREYMQNSTKDGSLWMRPPAVSFNGNSLSAFVNMDGGSFHFAILKACGNPIKPMNAPFASIYKRVVNVTQNPAVNYAADDNAHALEVNYTDVLKYEISIVNDGTTNVTNTVMTDTLPAGVTLVSNPSKRDFTVDYGTLEPGKPKIYTLTIKVDGNVANGSYINNKACFTASAGQKGCDTAVVKVKKPTVTPTPTPTHTPTPTPTHTPTPTPTHTPTPTPTHTPTPTPTHTPTPTPTSSVTPTPTPTHTPTPTPCVTTSPSPSTSPMPSVCATPTPTSTPTTTTLPDTGNEAPLTGLLGMGGMSYAGAVYIKSKKQLRDALRNWKK